MCVVCVNKLVFGAITDLSFLEMSFILSDKINEEEAIIWWQLSSTLTRNIRRIFCKSLLLLVFPLGLGMSLITVNHTFPVRKLEAVSSYMPSPQVTQQHHATGDDTLRGYPGLS
jgi:hypothetical protein